MRGSPIWVAFFRVGLMRDRREMSLCESASAGLLSSRKMKLRS